ncbi:MAG: hypothetical protein B7X50_02450 [Alishewanella sp. 34-51-39]|nr:MAG: hypothetical protein B7X50_02450 [Alishewanella sp. 34-51-39]
MILFLSNQSQIIVETQLVLYQVFPYNNQNKFHLEKMDSYAKNHLYRLLMKNHDVHLNIYYDKSSFEQTHL